MEYKELLIDKKTSLKTAMEKISESVPKILFVAEKDKLVGTLTDGDVRRYLTSGGEITDKAYDACNKKPAMVAHDLNEAKQMLSKHYVAIPIVDKANKITDIYIGNSNYKEQYEKISCPVIINAGGKGTRLYPFTKVLPKPLIPVGELTIIEHIMQRYEQFGCKKFNIIVNYKKELIKSYFKENDHKYKITWHDENEPLGTGGGLSLLKNKIKETFFFVTCDSMLLSDYSDILKYHQQHKNDITMVCAYKNMSIPYGIVKIDKKGNLSNIEEKPEMSFLTNTATYVVEPGIMKLIKDNTRIDFPEIIDLAKKKGKRIGIYPISESEWLDMGQMSELEKMRNRLYGE